MQRGVWKSAGEALRQIEDKGYAKPYSADERTVIRVGVNFNSKERTLDGWEVESSIGKGASCI